MSAWPIARLAEQHLHPRTATWLLTVVATVLAVCSALCLALLMVVGTAQLPGNPHRFLLAVQLAARANPFLRPLRTAVIYTAERWADEDAAAVVGNRRVVARAVGKAALVSRGAPIATLAGFAAAGPVPRRVAALLGPRTAPPPHARVSLRPRHTGFVCHSFTVCVEARRF